VGWKCYFKVLISNKQDESAQECLGSRLCGEYTVEGGVGAGVAATSSSSLSGTSWYSSSSTPLEVSVSNVRSAGAAKNNSLSRRSIAHMKFVSLTRQTYINRFIKAFTRVILWSFLRLSKIVLREMNNVR